MTTTTTRHFGASYLIHETDPEEVVTPEDLGDEERMIMQAFQDFADREVAPHIEELEKGSGGIGLELFKKAAELGIFMAEVPEEYGGLDLNVLAVTGMCSIRAKLGSLGSLIFGHQGIGMLPLINFATEDQRQRYLEPCMNGEMLSAFALTEPGTGSDAMNITTSAVLSEDGSHYLVNGGKQWITNAAWADIFILFVKVDGKHFSTLIVDGDSPGLTVGADERLLGQHGASINAIALEDVRVPAENLLGELGKGHKVAFCTLNVGRLKLATNSASGARKAVEVAAQYAAERHQFGRPIGDFGLIQRKLADMASRAYAAESVAYRTSGLVYHALENTDGQGPPTLDDKLNTLTEFSAECAMAKVFTSEAYNELADEALQVFGGYGFSEEYAPARMYRDSRITRIYEGTNEICRLYAQRAMLRRAWKGSLDFGGAIESLAAESSSDAIDLYDPTVMNWGFEPIGLGIRNLKKIYFYLVKAVSDGVEREYMFDADNQQFMASLADVAIEIFGAESTYLRVAKHKQTGTTGTELPEALARICFERSVERVRSEATEILAALSSFRELRSDLEQIEKWLPLPAGLIETRAFVARSVLDLGGLPASMT
ncbi:MAG: acyl-CoA dehydrogenase family protein [Gemmatimonadota bacterium]|jgi:alkylation response protein AidB-like acyl-CoA dehydrogenase|nr:acyl-CoA dehydrogenase family protein [Gemmatimonadota bacterium]